MRKLGQLLVLVGLGALLGAPVTLDPTSTATFTNCSSGGSVAQTLSSNRIYQLGVFDEEVWLCFASSASTCASGGVRYAAGVLVKLSISSDMKSVSCRSAGSTGDAEFTRLAE